MKYYILSINNKMVRNHTIVQDNSESNMFCSFTDDVNLAEKYTRKELMNGISEIIELKNYLDDYGYINGSTISEDYDFIEVEL
ncbi:MAG: hypothetical protein ACRDBY_05050 [Cetobacterium sp.]